jgi:hypothetical protein
MDRAHRIGAKKPVQVSLFLFLGPFLHHVLGWLISFRAL